uniref:Uncharacterized protein n=1 Tax=Setaria italica TaxID=4555 RepID=K3Y0U8_SETIT
MSSRALSFTDSKNEDGPIIRRNSICIRRVLRDRSIHKLDQLFDSTRYVKK